MLHPSGRILIFAKAPIAGACKTRLAAGIGPGRAVAVYRDLLAHTVTQVAGAGLAPAALWCAPDTGHPTFHRLRRRHGIALRRQPPGNLGQRMHRALADSLQRALYALLVGTDCPGLREPHLARALSALAAGDDAVFLPTPDGGYALIGLRRTDMRLFRGVAWSSATVMQATRRRLRRMGWQWRELPPLMDVDVRTDLIRAHRAGLLNDQNRTPAAGHHPLGGGA